MVSAEFYHWFTQSTGETGPPNKYTAKYIIIVARSPTITASEISSIKVNKR